MSNAHLLKGQKALEAFAKASYDIENLEPEIGELLINGRTAQAQNILGHCANLQRVLLKMTVHMRSKIEGGNFNER